MPKSAPRPTKKAVKKTKSAVKPAAKMVAKSVTKPMPIPKVVKPSESIFQKQFFLEHQERLHSQNPALKNLLYVLLVSLILLIAVLYLQGKALGMW